MTAFMVSSRSSVATGIVEQEHMFTLPAEHAAEKLIKVAGKLLVKPHLDSTGSRHSSD